MACNVQWYGGLLGVIRRVHQSAIHMLWEGIQNHVWQWLIKYPSVDDIALL